MPSEPRFSMSMSTVVALIGLAAGGFGAWTGLDGRVKALETTTANARLADVPVQISETKAIGEQNAQRLARIEALLERRDVKR